MKKFICLLTVLVLAVSYALSATASVPYQSYVYDAKGRPTPAPDSYLPEQELTGNLLGVGDFNTPSDIYCSADQEIYITDSGNNRIVVLNQDRSFKKEYRVFMNQGKKETLSSPAAVVVANDRLYISDTGNRRVLITDTRANVLQILTKPKDPLYNQKTDFIPGSLLVTDSGSVYVLVSGIYQGMVVFDKQGEFDGFFGASTVQPTLKLLADRVWKKLMSKEQRSKLSKYVPIEYSDTAIDQDGFIFATMAVTTNPKERISKLNATGTNVLSGEEDLWFGDREIASINGANPPTAFISLDLVSGKYMTALDRTQKRVFQYSRDGQLLTAFGGEGEMFGTFSEPVSICGQGSSILVLDAQKRNVTVFTPTPYGKLQQQTVDAYDQGLYRESMGLWEEVLKYDSSSVLAHRGIGKALYQIGKNEEAMEHFRIADDMKNYSEAYKQYRKAFLREHLAALIVVLVILIIATAVIIRLRLIQKAIKFIRRRRQHEL